MGIARLGSTTGESIEIRFLSDPYVKGTDWYSTPGSGGARSTKATDIQISLGVPPDRPLPDRVLVKLYAEPEEGAEREFQLILEQAGNRSYSGQLNERLLIMSGHHGQMQSYEQVAEFALIRDGYPDMLVDPVNQTTRFRINLDKAQFSS